MTSPIPVVYCFIKAYSKLDRIKLVIASKYLKLNIFIVMVDGFQSSRGLW